MSRWPRSPPSTVTWPKKPSRSIGVDYEVLPFVLDMNEALKPDAPKIWPEGNLSPNNRNEVQPISARRGDVAAALTTSARVFEDRYTTAFVHNAQMEPRACLAHWEGDKLTVYTPTGGIANCRHDMARDLGIPEDKVRVVVEYMGGNFGNKNQNQDADLITAMLAKEAGAPVQAGVLTQGGLRRRPRPLADDAELHGRYRRRRHADGDPLARRERHGALPEELRDDGRHRALQVRQHRPVRQPGVHESHGVGAISAGPSTRRGSSASSR